MVYLPHLVEGLGEEGTLRKQDLLALSEADNIPFEVQITIKTMTQAAQMALNKIDDDFEYAYKGRTVDQIQDHVRKHLAIYTEAVSKSKAQIGK